MNSLQNLAIFLAATDSENKIIQKLHRLGQKRNSGPLGESLKPL